MYMLHLYL